MSKWSIFALCIIAAVGLWFYNNGACPLQAMSPSSDTASSGSYQQITASQVKERLDKGDKIKFSARINDDGAGAACMEIARGRSVSKKNSRAFHPDWKEHWANEVEFGVEK